MTYNILIILNYHFILVNFFFALNICEIINLDIKRVFAIFCVYLITYFILKILSKL
jgi:hypothetical protein